MTNGIVTKEPGQSQIWQTVRYLLILAGGWLAGKGKLPMTEVEPMADTIVQILGLVVALGSVTWGLYVRYQTVSIPAAAAGSTPVVSTATGSTIKP